MPIEKNYDFRNRMRDYFLREIRRDNVSVNPGELQLDETWQICCTDPANELLNRAAFDLARFLERASGIRLSGSGDKKIIIRAGNSSGAPGCRFSVGQNEICIEGANPRGAFYGVIHLEDKMRMRGGAILEPGCFEYVPLARMRSTHSGSGLDDFPDWQLDAIVHAGFTAIDVFVSGIDETTRGYCDINDLIGRAERYGLDVVIYNYQTCYVHPDDPDSDQAFDRIFGALFRAYPKAAAIHLCGESLEFPSRDETTVKKSEVEEGSEGLQDTRQPTGYYPNTDYPAYLEKLQNAIRKAAPGAEVIFNTYNWGWAPLEPRREFLKAMPKGMTLQVTYDIFKQNTRDGLACPVMDYSIFAREPGEYFESEVKAAYEAGIRNIRVTSNLAGTTWDFGCVPFAPVPFRWIRRMEILRKYLLEYTVNSFYDSHHFGWFPNVCNDLAKAIFSNTPPADPERLLFDVAARDYGQAAAADIVEVWRIWSSAMDHYVASNEDQYGPWRVGPAYPFVFMPVLSRTMDDKNIQFPFTDNAFRCSCMVKPFYQPYENSAQSPEPLRYAAETRELGIMLEEWEQGIRLLEETLPLMDPDKTGEGSLLLGIGKFIRNSIRTTRGVKMWRKGNLKLQVCSTREEMLLQLDELGKLLAAERANVEDTFAYVDADSRLGWEPRMDYVCDRKHLEWKLRQLDIAETEMDEYRALLDL